MELLQSFTNNQQEIISSINLFPLTKENNTKGRKYKNFSSASEYRKWYYETYPEKKQADLARRRAKYLTKIGGKLKYNKSVKEHAESNLYKNWFKFFTSSNNLRIGYKKDGSNVKDPKLLDAKKFLKIIKTWHLNRQDRRHWSKYVEFDQMGIALGIKSKYTDYRFGCIDIDKSPSNTTLFKSRYVSNRIGSVHFYFLYKENDLEKKNLKIVLEKFKADFKMCQYMMAPLSINYRDDKETLYRIRGKGSFIIGKFEKASEVYNLLIQRVKRLQQIRQIKKEQKLLEAQIIQQPKIWTTNLTK